MLWEDLVNNVDLEKGMDIVEKHSGLLFELLSKYRPINNLIFKHFPYTYSGYGKYSDPLKFFTLCYIAAIC